MQTFSTRRSFLPLIFLCSLFLLLLGACTSLDSLDSGDSEDNNDDAGAQLQRSQVVGCWSWMETRNGNGTTVNQNQTGVNSAGPGNNRQMDLKEDGTYEDTFFADGEVFTEAGTWTIEEDRICFTPTSSEFRICFDGELVDGILRLIRIATEGNVSYWNLQSFSRGCE